jgi:hypothetical protein
MNGFAYPPEWAKLKRPTTVPYTPFVANLAGEGLLPRVDTLVSLQRPLVRETLAAHLTLVGFVVAVGLLVH